MKDERMEILKMVADKVISVEEGERLLRALDKSARRAGAGRSGHHGPRHRHHGDWDLGERLGEMGFRMQEFFDNAFGSMFGDEYWFDGYETVTGPAEDIVLDEEATLVISNPRHMYRSGSGDIRISPSSDEHLRLSSGRSRDVRNPEEGQEIPDPLQGRPLRPGPPEARQAQACPGQGQDQNRRPRERPRSPVDERAISRSAMPPGR